MEMEGCGHDDAEGLVCARCAVEGLRAGAAAAEELRNVSAAMEGYQEALERLGLVRRLATVWAGSSNPICAHVGKRLRGILDADRARLEVLRSTKLVREEEGPDEASEEGGAS